MKSLTALGVGLVVALAPGTAFAAPAEFGTGVGNAYGNCQHSSATGSHAPLAGGAGKGNGGHAKHVKAAVADDLELDALCVVKKAPPSTEESTEPSTEESTEETDTDAPPPVDGGGGGGGGGTVDEEFG